MIPLNTNVLNDIICLNAFKLSHDMIKVLSAKDASIIYEVINEAARAYRGVIPNDCYNEPYMPQQELRREMKGMIFFGWHGEGKIIGIIGFQKVKDVTLVRHA